MSMVLLCQSVLLQQGEGEILFDYNSEEL